MNTLQNFKQKGRILRKHLEAVFGQDVNLSLAYEAIAAMEGATDWNEFSAKLVKHPFANKSQQASGRSLPPIRAIFRTGDGQGVAEFNAAPWFAQASAEDIKALMNERPLAAPIGFEHSYGAQNGSLDEVAEFCADTNVDLKNVFAYIKGLSAVGKDSGRAGCYVDAHDVQRWLDASGGSLAEQAEVIQMSSRHSDSRRMIRLGELGHPAKAQVLQGVCASVWEHSVKQWASQDPKTCGYDFESAVILSVMSSQHIETTSYPNGEKVVRQALQEYGYYLQALRVREGIAKLYEPFRGIVLFSSLNDGDEFRDPSTRKLYRKQGVHRAAIADEESGKFLQDTKFFSKDFEVQLCAQASPENALATAIRHDMLKVIEVQMDEVVGYYEDPAEVPEWDWVEKHASFSHKGNGEYGVWEFMVNVSVHGNSGDMPENLKPIFAKAAESNAAWVMFHQGT